MSVSFEKPVVVALAPYSDGLFDPLTLAEARERGLTWKVRATDHHVGVYLRPRNDEGPRRVGWIVRKPSNEWPEVLLSGVRAGRPMKLSLDAAEQATPGGDISGVVASIDLSKGALPTTVVGTQYRDAEAQQLVRRLEQGQPLWLRREPSNVHDRRALAVLSDRVHLGYVPRIDHPVVNFVMDRRAKPAARVTRRWPSLRIEIAWELA